MYNHLDPKVFFAFFSSPNNFIVSSISSLLFASISSRGGIESYLSISSSSSHKLKEILCFFFSLTFFIQYFSKTFLKLSISVIGFSHSSAILTHFSHHSLCVSLFLFMVYK
ncbi:MAG: hypothetical protein LBQ24_04715 [Candidatus Peribacteria bacterium]|nr:hypothetical protein [Candidatus Peribacteria bacterium]